MPLRFYSYGSHSIVVYANDTVGNVGSSETSAFTVAKPASFPTLPVDIVLITAIALVTGLLVYFKKHKHQGTLIH
jgi:hypothetical protein